MFPLCKIVHHHIPYRPQACPAYIDERCHEAVETVFEGHIEHADIAVDIQHPARDDIVHIYGGIYTDSQCHNERYYASGNQGSRHPRQGGATYCIGTDYDIDVPGQHQKEQYHAHLKVLDRYRCRQRHEKYGDSNEPPFLLAVKTKESIPTAKRIPNTMHRSTVTNTSKLATSHDKNTFI